METLGNVFSDRSVLLTGHTGFKGSWLALWLHRMGASATGYALDPPTEPSHFETARIGELLTRHHVADIRDDAALGKALHDADPDVVIHMAAQSLVRESYRAPEETFHVNVGGTIRLLEAVRRRGKPCVTIVVTTDKCYENTGQREGYVETDPLGGHDPYSASKAAAELVVSCWRRSFFPPAQVGGHGVKLASVRAGNVIGGGDWARDRIVTDVMRGLMSGEPIPLRNPDATRPWQHVLEPLSGYLTLAARMLGSDDPALCDAWNFGPAEDEVMTVGELVQTMIGLWGGGRWEQDPAETPHEARTLQLNIDKAANVLGWSPRWTINQALERLVEWYRAYHADPASSMRDLGVRQIAAYEAARTGALAP